MSIKKKGAKGSLWASATRMTVSLLDFAVYAYLARVLPLDIFGFLGVGLLVVEFVNALVNAGINQNLIQRNKWESNYVNSTFSLILLTCLGFSLLIALVAGPLAYFLYSPLTGWILFALAGIPILGGIEIVFKAKLQRDFRNKKLSQIYVVASLCSSCLTLVLAFIGWGVWSIIVGKYVNSLLKITLLHTSSGVKIKLGIDRQHILELWQFIKPMVGAAVLTFFNDKTTNMLTAAVLGPASFAILNVAKKANRIVSDSTISPINSMMVPMFSRIGDSSAISGLYIRLVTVSTFIVIPIFMGLAAIADPFVTIAFGDKFIESAEYITIMSFTIFPAILSWYLPNLLVAKGKTNVAFKLTLFTLGANILVSVSTIWFGISTMLISVVAVNFLLLPLRFKIVNEYVDVDLRKLLTSISPQYICALLMFVSVYLVKAELRSYIGNEIVLLMVLISVGGLLYPLFNFIIFKKHTIKTLYEVKSIFLTHKT
ncbi:oligosaccharide flippase family protein [Paraglaciecola chathamensis]|uniref:oligosaccharide flippase family protein n=1 Tax=Paraglaciecola chathamensis TaxID=368405 RepID=UPI0027096C1E|nr:oligosaccharide flippase family protein [Paraglaciecola chathamensis]MDO6559196.1 oligosaccharide flippase family protein [Paraglaciecola chathamensis]